MGYLRSIEGNRQKKGTGALKTALQLQLDLHLQLRAHSP